MSFALAEKYERFAMPGGKRCGWNFVCHNVFARSKSQIIGAHQYPTQQIENVSIVYDSSCFIEHPKQH
jgi:hypothetical protein